MSPKYSKRQEFVTVIEIVYQCEGHTFWYDDRGVYHRFLDRFHTDTDVRNIRKVCRIANYTLLVLVDDWKWIEQDVLNT